MLWLCPPGSFHFLAKQTRTQCTRIWDTSIASRDLQNLLSTDAEVGKGRWCRLSKEDADAEKLSENVRAPDTDGAFESGIGLRTRYSSGLPLRASAFLNG